MIHYSKMNRTVNQLDNIINAINSRINLCKAAYTISLIYPGKETIRKIGGPCLNYIAIQLKSMPTRSIGLFVIYRNHDFLERTYGNYWGLCHLLRFLALETNCNLGSITCISSHAYISNNRGNISELTRQLNGIP